MNKSTLQKIDEYDARGEVAPWDIVNKQTTTAVMFAKPVAVWIFAMKKKYLQYCESGDVRNANDCVRRVVCKTGKAIFALWVGVICVLGLVMVLINLFG